MSRFAKFTWVLLLYNLVVIIWGAVVRATGSGAGCGAHWPTCHGDILPTVHETATLIEFTHRVTSGIVLLLVVMLIVWAWRIFPQGHPVRLGAMLVTVLTIIEALLGAGLVLFELVADNDSLARAIVMSLHLINTFLLLAALTLTGWWASGGPALQLRGQGRVIWRLVPAFVGMLALGMTGSVAALASVLFPSESVVEGFRANFDAASHVVVRLRILHPITAILVSVYIVFVARWLNHERPTPLTEQLSWALVGLFVVQLAVGAMTIVLLSSIWMQMTHLLLADLAWIVLVLLTASVLQVSNTVEQRRITTLERWPVGVLKR